MHIFLGFLLILASLSSSVAFGAEVCSAVGDVLQKWASSSSSAQFLSPTPEWMNPLAADFFSEGDRQNRFPKVSFRKMQDCRWAVKINGEQFDYLLLEASEELRVNEVTFSLLEWSNTFEALSQLYKIKPRTNKFFSRLVGIQDARAQTAGDPGIEEWNSLKGEFLKKGFSQAQVAWSILGAAHFRLANFKNPQGRCFKAASLVAAAKSKIELPSVPKAPDAAISSQSTFSLINSCSFKVFGKIFSPKGGKVSCRFSFGDPPAPTVVSFDASKFEQVISSKSLPPCGDPGKRESGSPWKSLREPVAK